MGQILIEIIQVFLLLALAPLINGIIKKIKARLQNRSGPKVFQAYYDLDKLFHKSRVISQHSSWLFTGTPIIVFSCTVGAALLVPVLNLDGGFRFGDLFLFIYLLGMARFFSALAGMDAGSSFGGMGSSREMFFAVLIEPTLLLSLFTVVLSTGSTSFTEMGKSTLANANMAHVLGFLALFIAAIAETGRVPVDNPDTHLELTMVHEGMILEYSGKELGLIIWAQYIKQLLLLTLLVNIFFPAGMAVKYDLSSMALAMLFYILKVLLVAISMAVIETAFAKLRLFKVPKLMLASFMFSFFGLVILLGGKM